MFKHKRKVLAVLVISSAGRADAFIDPFAVLAGINAVSGAIGAVKEVDEAADIGISAAELLGDFGLDSERSEELGEQVKRLEEIARKTRSISSLKSDSENAFKSIEMAKSHSNKIRSVRGMFDITKKISSLLGLRPKAADRALKVQDTKLNYLILDELIAIRRAEIARDLEASEKKAKLNLALDGVLQEERNRKSSRFTP